MATNPGDREPRHRPGNVRGKQPGQRAPYQFGFSSPSITSA